MSTFQIRLIAIIAMVIDHIGLFFFPQFPILRIIGRLSFPLFAWLIANGARYTKNRERYLKRLFILACVSQLPFTLANNALGYSYWFFNVVFTLCLGLVVILTIQKTTDVRWHILMTVIACVVAYGINSDYGIVGVLSVVCFYIFFNSPRHLVISQTVVVSLAIIWDVFMRGNYHELTAINVHTFSEFISLIALVFIYLYNKKEGIKAKYLFYIFYPVQYVVIYLLQLKLY